MFKIFKNKFWKVKNDGGDKIGSFKIFNFPIKNFAILFLCILFFEIVMVSVMVNSVGAQVLVPLPSGVEDERGDARGTYTICDMFKLIKNIANFIVILAPVIAGLMFLIGGFIILTAGGNEGKVKQGQGMMTQALIGILLIFGAWVIVNTVILILTGKGVQQWQSTITC